MSAGMHRYCLGRYSSTNRRRVDSSRSRTWEFLRVDRLGTRVNRGWPRVHRNGGHHLIRGGSEGAGHG